MKTIFQKIDKLFLISIVELVVFCGCLFLSKYMTENIQTNFNYDSVSETTGTVSEIEVHNNHILLCLDLEDGRQIRIDTGNKLKHSLNEAVSVYTDGKHYGLSKDDIIVKETHYDFWCIIGFLSVFGVIIAGSAVIAFLLALFFNSFERAETKKEMKNVS